MSNPSTTNKAIVQKADRYCAWALVCLTSALVVLSVGVFLVSPVSTVGLISLAIGIILLSGCIVLFALYSHYEKASHS